MVINKNKTSRPGQSKILFKGCLLDRNYLIDSKLKKIIVKFTFIFLINDFPALCEVNIYILLHICKTSF
ncbi:MAG: hypothetical protein C0430_04475 [Flavobacterium sp.]|nr:hypothetical protein [Flavobacterium sp.]